MTQASRSVRVYVHDPAGMPVPGAVVEVIWAWDVSLATTAAEGFVILDIPPDVRVQHILALKAGSGLDYFENYRSWPPGDQIPALPPEIHLVLDGAREVSVQAVDSSGRPVPNVQLTPWTIKKAGKLAYVNCSGSRAAAIRTDADGFARFGWVPASLEDVTQFRVADRAYHSPRAAWIDLAHPHRPLTVRLLRNTRVAGRVLSPDGCPAPGISVRAEGRGRTNSYCRRETKSGPDGIYEFLLYPEQSYLIAVADDDWAARSLRGVRIREGQPIADLDIRLTRGTRVYGQVTLGPEHQPAQGQTVTVIEQGEELGEELRGCFEREELVRWAETDRDGRYELRLGPGRYRFQGPTPSPEEQLIVEAEAEIVRDFHLPYLARGLLTGEVRRLGEVGEAVAQAVVCGMSSVLGHGWFETVADGEGRFSSERWRDPTLVYARDPDGGEAGCTEIGEQDEAVAVRVRPAAAVRGTVVDRSGCPRSNEKVFCRMRVALRDGSSVVFQFEVRTDIAGAYEVAGLLVGSFCDLTALRGHHPTVAWMPFSVPEPGVVELPQLVLDEATS